MPEMSPEFHLLQALAQARERRGFCAPNPSVGAVVERRGEIISRANHRAAGSPHAEVGALEKWPGEFVEDDVLYVTLEPCCHFGRTPPCTDLLIRRGIKKVRFGYFDPNPKVAGKGQATLLDAGIDCAHFPHPEIDAFYESYAHWTKTKMPFVTAKIAMSLDGKTAGPDGAPLILSGPDSAQFTHRCRRETDAILTTQKTVVADNPRLNARFGQTTEAKRLYLVDNRLEIHPHAKIRDSGTSLTIFCSETTDASRMENLRRSGHTIVPVPEFDKRLSLEAVLGHIGKDGVHDLWVEAGGTLFRSLLAAHHLNRAFIYSTLHWLGASATSAFGDSPAALFDGAKTVRWSANGSDGRCEVNW